MRAFFYISNPLIGSVREPFFSVAALKLKIQCFVLGNETHMKTFYPVFKKNTFFFTFLYMNYRMTKFCATLDSLTSMAI